MLVPWKLVSLLYNIQATTSDQHRELLPNSKFAGDSQDPQCGWGWGLPIDCRHRNITLVKSPGKMRGRSFWWMIASTCHFICGMDWYLYDRLKRSKSLSNICVLLVCWLRVLAGQDIKQYNIPMFRRNCRSFLSLRRRRWRLRDRLFPGTHGGNSICKCFRPTCFANDFDLPDFSDCWIQEPIRMISEGAHGALQGHLFPMFCAFLMGIRIAEIWDNTIVLVDMIWGLKSWYDKINNINRY